MKKNVLDHGSVELIEAWGSDEGIIDTARVSTDGGFVSWDPYEGHPKGDTGLLAYLWRNKHSTPFEMAGVTVDVTAPIFVIREWHRHRTMSYSEVSARYSPLSCVDYVPSIDRVVWTPDTANKQSSRMGNANADASVANSFVKELERHYAATEELYQKALAHGIPKELARVCLTVGRYTRMRATANLRNWLAFLSLREANNAQHEIRVYAHAVNEMLSLRFPRVMALYNEGNT